MNQVTVITVFTILNNSPLALTNFGASLVEFIKEISLGFLAGMAFSWVMGRAVRRIVNDYIQEVNLTVTTTYLLFWVVNRTFVCSGCMAVVTYGLYMSAYGKTLISPTVEKRLMYFWEILSNASESIVLVMGGLILCREFVVSSSLTANDIYKLLMMYLSQLLIRFVVILMHYPLLSRFGYGISFNKAVILCLGGIKGVISTALAIVAANGMSYDQEFRALVLLLIIGTTFITIIVNPLLLILVERKFRILHVTEIQENLLLRVTSNILQKTYKKLEKLEKSKEFPLVRWNEVVEIAGPRELVIAVMKRSRVGRLILKEHQFDSSEMLISRFCDGVDINEAALLSEMRKRFYNSLKEIYWHEFESGQCLGQTLLVLVNAASFLQHKDTEPIQDWKLIESEIYNKEFITCFGNVFNNRVTNCLYSPVAYYRIIKAYDAASTFLKAHKKVRTLFDSMEIDLPVLQKILDESHIQRQLCTAFLRENIIDQHPQIIADVQSKMACFALLISQRKLINKIYQQGVIKNLEYSYLVTAIDTNFKTLTFLSTPKHPPLRKTLKMKFKKASTSEINYLASATKELHLKPGEMIFAEDDECSGAYLIISGTVHEFSSWVDQELTDNNIVGAQYLLPGLDQHNTSTAITLTVVTAVQLPKKILDFECFEEEIYKEASEEFLILNKDKFNLRGAKNDHIMFLVGRSYVKRVYIGSLVSLRRGGIVMKGRIRSDKGCYSLLRPIKKCIESIDDAILLIFPPHFSRMLKNNRSLVDALCEYYIKNSKITLKTREFYSLKENTGRRETKIYKKIMKYADNKDSMNSLDKMLNV